MSRTCRALSFVIVCFMMLPEELCAKKLELDGISDDIVSDFSKEYSEFLTSGRISTKLQRIIDALKAGDPDNDEKECIRCHAAAGFMLQARQVHHASDERMRMLAQDLCQRFKMQKTNVCAGLIDLNLNLFLYIVDNKPELNKEQVCGMLYQHPDCVLDDPAFDWKVDIDNTTQSDRSPEIQDRSTLNIIQISDVHYDYKYQERALAACGEPACCRSSQGLASRPEDGAGRWGDYRHCDSPWEALVDAFDQIKRQHKQIDLIYFTGDIVDHGTWETSFEANKRVITEVTTKMGEISPGTILCPVLGNHEAHPFDVYAPDNVPSELSTQWLYDLVADKWGELLHNSALDTIRKGGYYTQIVRPGLRVIALNNNVAYVYNWWLLYDPVFPKKQLQWLHDTLLQSETINEKVHILGHIPAGDVTNFVTWDREYHRIVERFSNTIAGQFNGHTHNDEFRIFYSSSNDSVPVSVAFNGGSVTAFTDRNPNYKLYQLESGTYKILNHESWIYNLTAANLATHGRPEWFKMYSFKDEYGLSSLQPEELDKLVQKMAKDKNLATKYVQFKSKLADSALAKGCDKKCLERELCEIVRTVPDDYSKCISMIFSSSSKIKDIFSNRVSLFAYGMLMVWYHIL